MLVKFHLCRDCKKQDAYTLSGRTRCFECAERDRQQHRKRRSAEAGRASNIAYHNAWKDKKQSEDLCTYCGRHKVESGKKICKSCVINQSSKRREKRIQDGMNWPRGANGFCFQCNKEKAIDGKRLCQKCYDVKMANLEKRRLLNAEYQQG